ncbi:MAG: IS200/IS605 family transposase [Candidatus Pacebacteria bacterium]|jgi:putative transposase|nr:IS200/IS605 family transposase [Candidatus Paceibacterota bacterium]
MDIRIGRHVVFNLHAHIVFVPKYRKNIFDSDALEKLHRIFRIVCADFEADLKEFNGEKDHVHLLVNYPPKVSLSKLVNSLKGVSSRRLRQERKDIEKKYWNGGLWSPSYFVGSVGGAPIEILKKYIQDQESPGGERSTSPSLKKGFSA